MVCIYCGNSTQVVNSRLQKRANQVWRRRQCTMCKSIFTTQEAAELSSSLVVQYSSQDLRRFSKEQLLMSIYDSCKHRRNAADDATALTQTIVGRLLKAHKAGALKRNDLVTIAHEVLHHFDLAAATFYQAYHPLH